MRVCIMFVMKPWWVVDFHKRVSPWKLQKESPNNCFVVFEL